jgi:hypothetical protein
MASRRFLFASLLAVLLVAPGLASAQVEDCCTLADNGNGTVDLPPNCSVGYLGAGQIRDGLPAGSPVNAAARLVGFNVTNQGAGGALGGEFQQWTASLELSLTGTGIYLGYNRFVILPMQGETHSAPRVPFTPVQSFDMNMHLLQGQITGDPDFDLLRVTGGYGFGMPSPGHTTLTQVGTQWAVDSFFDITYRIDFVGNNTGTFAGRSGSTTEELKRFDMCHEHPVPARPATWGRLKASYR